MVVWFMLIYIDAFNPSRLIPSLVHMSQEKRKGSVTPSLVGRFMSAMLVQQQERMQMQMQHMFMMSAVMGMGMAPPASSGSSSSSPSIGFPLAAMHFGGFPAPPGLTIKKEEKHDGCIEIKEELHDDAEEVEEAALAVDVDGAQDRGEQLEQHDGCIHNKEEPHDDAKQVEEATVTTQEEEQMEEERKVLRPTPKHTPKAMPPPWPPWARGTKRTRAEHAIQDDGLKPNPMIICS